MQPKVEISTATEIRRPPIGPNSADAAASPMREVALIASTGRART